MFRKTKDQNDYETAQAIRAFYKAVADGADQLDGERHAWLRSATFAKRNKPILAGASSMRVSAKSPNGEAREYIAKYWDGLCLFLLDGRIELNNNSAERTIRPIALNRKNAVFAGHDARAQNWALLASLIETSKLNSVDPHAWLTATLQAVSGGRKQSKID